ncbi:hypothetical protein JCM10369A_00700 [Nocardioides pyridinolyticus]
MPLAAATYLLSGCGGTTDAGTTAEGELTLKDICPKVESALPGEMQPKPAALERFAAQLNDLREQGDREAQDALDLLITPTEVYLDQASAQDPELPNANLAWLVGIDELAERCEAAGSSALQ